MRLRNHEKHIPHEETEHLKHIFRSLLMARIADKKNDSTMDDTSFVFHDFEKSNVLSIRQNVRNAPERYLFLFMIFVLFWTALMSAAAGVHGSDNIALNLVPHVALYCAAVGLFLYPLHLFWIPLVAFFGVFAYSVVQPFVTNEYWFHNPSFSSSVIALFFVLNIATAVFIALLMQAFLFFSVRASLRPHTSDLIVSLGSYFAFVIGCFVQFQLFMIISATFTPEARLDLGIGETFQDEAISRILRGGVVLAAFFIAAIEIPNKSQLRGGLILSLVFPFMAALQFKSITFFPALDTALVVICLAVIFPVPITITACIVGFPIYALTTGNYLKLIDTTNPAETLLDHYASIALFLMIFIMVFRSYTYNLIKDAKAEIRRLNKVRRFSETGLFFVDIPGQRYRLDQEAAKIMDINHEGALFDFLHSFKTHDRDRLTESFSLEKSDGDILSLCLSVEGSIERQIKVMIWTEKSSNGNIVGYGLILSASDSTHSGFANGEHEALLK